MYYNKHTQARGYIMKYSQLLEKLQQMSGEELNQDVTVFCVGF